MSRLPPIPTDRALAASTAGRPLSPVEQPWWHWDRLLAPGAPLCIECVWRLDGTLDADRLEAALRAVIAAEPALRARLHDADGVPTATPLTPRTAARAFRLERIEVPDAERTVTARTRALLDAPWPDDPRQPPIRAWLLALQPDRHRLVIAVRASVFDRTSVPLFAQAIVGAFQRADAAHGREPRDPPPGDALPVAGAMVDSAPAAVDWPWPRLPADRPGRGLPGRSPAVADLGWPASASRALQDLATRHRVPIATAGLAVFATLLARLAGQRVVAVEVPTGPAAGDDRRRMGRGVDRTVLRVDTGAAGEGASPAVLASLIARLTTASLRPDPVDLSAGYAAAVAVPPPGRQALRVAFGVDESPLARLDLPGVRGEALSVDGGLGTADLRLSLVPRGDTLVARWTWVADRLDRDTVARWSGLLATLVEGLARDEARPLAAVPLLVPAEREALLAGWQGPRPRRRLGECLHDAFEQRARRQPQSVAVAVGSAVTDYRSLDRRSATIAHRLVAAGLRPGEPVGVCLPAGVARLAAALAVLRAGGALLPLGIDDPPAVVADTVLAAALRFLVADAGTAVRFAGLPVTALDPDAAEDTGPPAASAGLPQVLPQQVALVWAQPPAAGAADAVPRLVCLGHAALVNLVLALGEQLALGPADVVWQTDRGPAVQGWLDAFVAWSAGARVALPPQGPHTTPGGDASRPAWLAQTVADAHVTVLMTTAPVLSTLLQQPPLAAGGALQRVVLLGAAPTRGFARALRARLPAVRLHRLQMPMAAGADALWHDVVDVADGPGRVPAGRPIAHARCAVVDPRGDPVPDGIAGELRLGGRGRVRDWAPGDADAEAITVIDDAARDLPATGDRMRGRAGGELDPAGDPPGSGVAPGGWPDGVDVEAWVDELLGDRPRTVTCAPADGGGWAARVTVQIDPDAAPALQARLKTWLAWHGVDAEVHAVAALGLPPLPRPAGADGADRPSAGVESVLLDLARDLLRRPSLQADDALFARHPGAGAVLRLVDAASRSLGLRLLPGWAWEAPTVAALAERAATAAPWSPAVDPPPDPDDVAVEEADDAAAEPQPPVAATTVDDVAEPAAEDEPPAEPPIAAAPPTPPAEPVEPLAAAPVAAAVAARPDDGVSQAATDLPAPTLPAPHDPRPAPDAPQPPDAPPEPRPSGATAPASMHGHATPQAPVSPAVAMAAAAPPGADPGEAEPAVGPTPVADRVDVDRTGEDSAVDGDAAPRAMAAASPAADAVAIERPAEDGASAVPAAATPDAAPEASSSSDGVTAAAVEALPVPDAPPARDTRPEPEPAHAQPQGPDPEPVPAPGPQPAPAPEPEPEPEPEPAVRVALPPGRQAAWLRQQLDPAGVGRPIARLAGLRGVLDVARLEAAWADVVAHRPALRTRVAWAADGLSAWVEPAGPAAIESIDLSQAPEPSGPQRGSLARWRLSQALDRPLRPDHLPLHRLVLLREAPDRHQLLWIAHPATADDAELAAWQHDLAQAYVARGEGRPWPPLDAPTQGDTDTGLDGAPPPAPPVQWAVDWPWVSATADRQPQQGPSATGRDLSALWVERTLPAGRITRLRELARVAGVEPADLLLAAVVALSLGRDGRIPPVLRVDRLGGGSEGGAAGRARPAPVRLQATAFDLPADAPFVVLVRLVAALRRAASGRSPDDAADGGGEADGLASVAVAVGDTDDHAFALPDDAGLSASDLPLPGARIDADRAVRLHLGVGLLQVGRATDRLDMAPLQAWTDALLDLLDAVSAGPNRPLADLPITGRRESMRLARHGGLAAAQPSLVDPDACPPAAADPVTRAGASPRRAAAQETPSSSTPSAGEDLDPTVVDAGVFDDAATPRAAARAPADAPADATAEATVHRVVERGSRRARGRAAIEAAGAHWSHDRLQRHADHLAQLLRDHGIRRGCRVVLELPVGVAGAVALLAVAKAGGTGVCLDPRRPADERRRAAAQAGAVLGLVTSDPSSASRDPSMPWLVLGEHGEVVDADGVSDVVDLAAADDFGLPPDALRDARAGDAAFIVDADDDAAPPGWRHRSIAALLAACGDEPGLAVTDRVLAIARPGSARAVLEVLLPLSAGATVRFASPELADDPAALAAALDRAQATVLLADAATWQRLVDQGWPGRPVLAAWVDGPTLAPALATALLARCRSVWRFGGWPPAAPWGTRHRVSGGDPPSLIGRPVPGTAVQLRDPHGRLVPAGSPGVVWIAGAGLTVQGRADAVRGSDAVAWWCSGRTARWCDDGTLAAVDPDAGHAALTHPCASTAPAVAVAVPAAGEAARAQALAPAWAAALDRPQASVDDDFFALGGTPEQALRLLRTIAAADGPPPTLAMLAQAPTPRRWARRVSASGTGPLGPMRWRVLANTDGTDAERPLFVLGDGASAHALAARLGGPWLVCSAALPADDEAEAAWIAAAAAAMHDAVPAGALRLVGLGETPARLAATLDARLRAEGRPLAKLVLLDPRMPPPPAPDPTRGSTLGWLGRMLRRPFERPDAAAVTATAPEATDGGRALLLRPAGGGRAGDAVAAQWAARLGALRVEAVGGDPEAWRTSAGDESLARAVARFLVTPGDGD